MALYEHYKDGPLWIGLDSCGFQELKTVLGTTEKEIQAHGFETHYECSFYDLDVLDDRLTRSITYTDPHSDARRKERGLETEEELDRLTELMKQTQSQKEVIEQSLNKEESEEEDRGR